MRYLDEHLTVDEPADEVLRGVGEAVAHLRKVTVKSVVSGQVMVVETWRPVWTILVAILLFPVGLLALLVVNRATLVINAVPAGDGAHVDVTGEGHEHVCDAVLTLFSQVQ